MPVFIVYLVLIFIKLFRIFLVLKLFLLTRILLAVVLKAFTSFDPFVLDIETVSLVSIVFLCVVVLIIYVVEVSLCSFVLLSVKLGSIVVRFLLDYLISSLESYSWMSESFFWSSCS